MTTTEKKLTKKQQQELQDARVFAVLSALPVGNAEQIADDSGDPDSDTFCTPAQATAALKRFEKLGLVEDAGDDPRIKRARRRLKRWQLTHLGQAMADAIYDVNEGTG